MKVREKFRLEESSVTWREEEMEWTVRYTSGTQSPKLERRTVVGEMTKPRKKEKRKMEEEVEEEVKREENKNEDGKEAAEVGILEVMQGWKQPPHKRRKNKKRKNRVRRREKGKGGVRDR